MGGVTAADNNGARTGKTAVEAAQNAAAETAKKNESEIADKNWKNEMDAKVLDLSTTHRELMELGEYAMKSEGLMHYFQSMMALRSRMTEMFSNLLKMLHDTSRTIISNMRV